MLKRGGGRVACPCRLLIGEEWKLDAIDGEALRFVIELGGGTEAR